MAINRYAFETSPYPVILSLETHCHIPQQQKMAEYMKTILGDKIAVPLVFAPDQPKVCPSPEDLKHKILIKGKRLPKTDG